MASGPASWSCVLWGRTERRPHHYRVSPQSPPLTQQARVSPDTLSIPSARLQTRAHRGVEQRRQRPSGFPLRDLCLMRPTHGAGSPEMAPRGPHVLRGPLPH